ncbi:MAG: hypothetical protein QJR03_01515 [Sphaerobacter sp.]|nr:hypothetical protein [Sphaerobacter sp.]
MGALARAGCIGLMAIAGLMLFMAVIVPLLALLALAGVAYLFVLLWRSPLSLRTKRAITGVLIYPAGLYFLWRYTRHDQTLKLAALAVAIVATLLMAAFPPVSGGLVPLLGAGFLVLFLLGAESAAAVTYPAVAVTEAPAGRVDVTRHDRRRLLEIEQAHSAAERRVLQVREFSRLASAALAAPPEDPASWPTARELASLREQARVLRSSLADPVIRVLPDPNPNDPVPADLLAQAIDALASYTALLATTPSRSPDLERLRVVARERARLAALHDEVSERLTPSRPWPTD